MCKILLCLVMLPLLSLAEAQNSCMFRLLRNPGEIKIKPENAERIKSIGFSYKTTDIIVETYDNRRVVLATKQVWGYQEKDCAIYRNFNARFFKIEQAGEMIIYSVQAKGFKSQVITTYYFSKSVNTAVFLLNKENLFEQFKTNACFLEKLKQRFKSPFDYVYWNKKGRSFEIIDMLHVCK